MNISRWASTIASASIAALLLAGCSASDSVSSTGSTSVSREARVLGSELCILNDTPKTIHWVGELGPYKNDDHHPDAAGPLAPGAKWCTNGYNSYAHGLDVAAQIIFTRDGSDKSSWGADNNWFGQQLIRYTYANGDVGSGTTFEAIWSWEMDVTLPEFSQPNHDYHLRRLDDTEFFKEWLVTVRR